MGAGGGGLHATQQRRQQEEELDTKLDVNKTHPEGAKAVWINNLPVRLYRASAPGIPGMLPTIHKAGGGPFVSTHNPGRRIGGKEEDWVTNRK